MLDLVHINFSTSTFRIKRINLSYLKYAILHILIFIRFLFSLFSTLVIICFIFCKQIQSNAQVKPLIHLLVADFFLAFVWVSANAIYLEKNDLQTLQESSMSCFIWQLVTEVFWFIYYHYTFLLILVFTIVCVPYTWD